MILGILLGMEDAGVQGRKAMRSFLIWWVAFASASASARARGRYCSLW